MLIPSEHTSCVNCCLVSSLMVTQGALLSMNWFALSARAMISRTAWWYLRFSKSAAMLSDAFWNSAISSGSITLSDNLPSKRLVIKLAQRLAMLTTLPTRSEFTFCAKSVKLRSMSVTPSPNLDAK